jgi:hypothetical protein
MEHSNCEAHRQPFGIRYQPNVQPILRSDYEQALAFIASKAWKIPEPVLQEDKDDPLLNKPQEYGSYMNSFDFHLTP